MALIRIKDLTTQARSIAADDFDEIDGATNGSRKVAVTEKHGIFSGSRQIKDLLYSDGVTSNRRAEFAPGAPGALAGAAVSFPFEFDWSTTIQATDANIFSCGTTLSLTPVQGLRLALGGGTATLYMDEFGAGGVSDFRRLAWAGAQAIYAGTRVRGMVVFASPNSTTAPVIYINGVDVTANFTGSTGGTPPNWIHTALDMTKFWCGYNLTPGRYFPHSPILSALSAAEVLDWTQSGRLPAWCEITTGNMVALYASDFSVNNDSWTNNGGITRTANIDTNADGAGMPPSNDWLRFINSSGSAGLCIPQRLSLMTVGRRYFVSIDILCSTGSGVGFVSVGLTSTGIGANPSKFTFAVTPGTVITVSGYITAINSTGIQITPSLDAAGSSEVSVPNGLGVYIKNVIVREMGPIFKPIIQPISVVADAGANKIAGLLLGSVSPITDRKDWVIQALTNFSGNQQLLGVSVFPLTSRFRIDSWTINNGGTSKLVSLGNVSAGTQYLSLGTAAAGLNDVPLTSRFNLTNDLWCNSNGVDALQHTVRGTKVD